MNQFEHIKAIEVGSRHAELVNGKSAYACEVAHSPTLHVRVVFGHLHEVIYHHVVHGVAHSLDQVTLHPVVRDEAGDMHIVRAQSRAHLIEVGSAGVGIE